MSLFEPLRGRSGLWIVLAIVGFIAFRALLSFLPDWIHFGFLAGATLWCLLDWFFQTEPVRRFLRESRLRRAGGDTAPVLKALYAHWDAGGILSSEAATLSDVKAFEQQYGVTLPDDMRTYFRTVNGTRKGEAGRDDERGIGFWHLAQVRTFQEAHVSEAPGADCIFAFADHSLGAVTYGIRLSADGEEPAPVFGSFSLGLVQIAPSFGEFLTRYATGNPSALFPRIVTVADDEGIGAELDGVVTYSVRWVDVRVIFVQVLVVDGTADAVWVIEHEGAWRPFVTPVDLVGGSRDLRTYIRSMVGFDEAAFLAARDAEARGTGGSFIVWRQPDWVAEDPAQLLSPPSSDELKEFERRCRDVDGWCASRQLDAMRTLDAALTIPEKPTIAELRATVERVVSLRRQPAAASVDTPKPRGRVLLCAFTESPGTGASQLESNGFFDERDRPPTDTWVWVLDSWSDEWVVLAAWMPTAAEPIVEAVMEVNPCIVWLDEAPQHHPFVRAVRTRLLQESELRPPWEGDRVDLVRALRKRRQA